MTTEERIKSGVENLTYQFNNTGDSPWLEGWICGYTDHDSCGPSKDNDVVHDVLFDHLMSLRNEMKAEGERGATMNYSEIQKDGMTVGDLISILSRCDQSLPVATEAMGHIYASKGDRPSHGLLRVCLLKHYSGYHILIGNPSKMNINKPNWYIVEDLTPDLDGYPLEG